MQTLIESLPELGRQLADAERQAAEATRTAEALRKIIDGVQALNGHAGDVRLSPPVIAAMAQAIPPEDVNEMIDGPRGREAVRLITAERPGVWALSDLRAEMKRRGWFTSNKGGGCPERRGFSAAVPV